MAKIGMEDRVNGQPGDHSRRPLRVLIVEDDDNYVEILEEELKHGGYEALTTDWVDTPETVERALDEKEWDVVLSDHFSAPDPWAVLKMIQKRDLDVPLIVVSGHVGEKVANEAMEAGARAFIGKNNLDPLIPTIEQALGEKLLGPRLVAYVAGIESGEEANRQESAERIRAAREIAQLLSEFDSLRVVKAWFIGPDPQLGEVSPAEAIREGKLREAKDAAHAFVAGA